MRRFEPVIDDLGPSCVMVVGDVNSTLACSLVATKKHVPVVHVEAGLRSFDRRMPEEINRLLTDQISEVLYTTERSAQENLAREGVAPERIHFVGNVMIDSLQTHLKQAVPMEATLVGAGVPKSLISDGPYGVVTLHRPSNVDTPQALSTVLAALEAASRLLPLVWPMHPRARANVERFGLDKTLSRMRVALLPPQGYLEMLGLMRDAAVVLTDSGGIQEETTALGVPCLTLRENTERPITVEQGTNTVVGNDRQLILDSIGSILSGEGKKGRLPELWDGRASQRIAEHLAAWLDAARDRIAA
jgi:UDP-N-acetylglucosamine 2-epimerase (non-hydrolysing)